MGTPETHATFGTRHRQKIKKNNRKDEQHRPHKKTGLNKHDKRFL
jgi:hypothetical protein